MIRELNQANIELKRPLSVVGLTLLSASLIFKKCMIIDEDKFV